MNKIPTSEFILLWDKLLRLEKESDSTLAKRLGITAGAVSHWRRNRSRAVHYSLLKKIEEKLQYRISNNDQGKWDLVKVSTEQSRKEIFESMPRRHLEHIFDLPIIERFSYKNGKLDIPSYRLKPIEDHFNSQWIWYRLAEDYHSPAVQAGDYCLVNLSRHPLPGELALVLLKDAPHPVLQRLLDGDKKTIRCQTPKGVQDIELNSETTEFFSKVYLIMPSQDRTMGINQPAFRHQRLMASLNKS